VRVLVVEDDPDLSQILREGLAEDGYAVDVSATAEDGFWRATTVAYDVAVLDVMLPDRSGFDLLRDLRRRGGATPVLMLTARDATEDRVEGLDAGADDYLVKPFAWEELGARIRALLRRGPHGSDALLRHDRLVLDPARREVRIGAKPVDLTAKEFEIVRVLASEPGRVFSRTEIIERVYDDDHDGMSNVVDVLLSRIRRKLAAADGGASWIRTRRGVGYALSREEPA
jgi:two-component system OmpR family response regulator